MLYKAMVRSHLEYANSFWNPYHVQEIKALEQVQMRATKILPSLKNKSYEERLKITVESNRVKIAIVGCKSNQIRSKIKICIS